MRDSAGLAPDFAGWLPPQVALGSWAPYKPTPDTVKAHQMIRCDALELHV